MLLSHPREPDPDIETPPALVTLLKKPEWEEELVRASARVAVVGSESVAKAVQDVDEAFGAFWDALARFERLAQGDPSSVEASRDALSQRVRGLEEQMRKDVRR
jgi:hypothetical protein